MARNEQEQVGGAVDLGKAVLREAAKQTHAVGNTALPRQSLDGSPLRPLPDDDQLDARQPGQRLDHETVPLQRHEIADREKGRRGEVEGLPRGLAVARLELSEIDPIAQHAYPLGGDPEMNQPLLQPARYANQAVGIAR